MGPARTGAGTQPLPVVPGLESPGVPEPREQVLPLAAPGPRSRATSPFRGHFPSRPAPRPPPAAAPPLLRCPSPSSAYLVPVRPFPVVRKRKPRPEQKPCLCPLACPSGTLSLPCLSLCLSLPLPVRQSVRTSVGPQPLPSPSLPLLARPPRPPCARTHLPLAPRRPQATALPGAPAPLAPSWPEPQVGSWQVQPRPRPPPSQTTSGNSQPVGRV